MRKIARIALLLPIMIFAIASISNANDSFKEAFKILKSEVNYSQEQKCNFITCIGEIKNLTNDVWENFVLEVKYFNADGKLIDTETENLYDNVLQPKDTMTFRVRVQADRDASEYVSHALRITSAQKQTNYAEYYNTKKKSSPWMNILISWTPMLILIAVWVFFMYWSFAKKKSPQARAVDIMAGQAKLMEEKNNLLERIAIAMENDLKKDE